MHQSPATRIDREIQMFCGFLAGLSWSNATQTPRSKLFDFGLQFLKVLNFKDFFPCRERAETASSKCTSMQEAWGGILLAARLRVITASGEPRGIQAPRFLMWLLRLPRLADSFLWRHVSLIKVRTGQRFMAYDSLKSNAFQQVLP